MLVVVALSTFAAFAIVPSAASALTPEPLHFVNEVTAPEASVAGAHLGGAVAIDGDVAVAGAPGEGAAYVLGYSASGWRVVQRLRPDGLSGSERFGLSVATSNGIIVVSACPVSGVGGRVYVFTPSGSTWSQTAILMAPDGLADDFGASVDVDGVTIVVGAPGDDSIAEDAGAAYSFVRDGQSWILGDPVWHGVPPTGPVVGPSAGDRFGASVSLFGDVALVGAPGAAGGAGYAYVFHRNDGDWVESSMVTSMDPRSGGGFGWAVALAEQGAIVGEPGWEPSGQAADADFGAVYFFLGSGGTLSHFGMSAAVESGSRLGTSVALSGTMAIAGASQSMTHTAEAGEAIVFTRGGAGLGIWTLRQTLRPAGGSAADGFGAAVALFAKRALVGAPMADTAGTDSGAAYGYSAAQQDIYRFYNVRTGAHFYTPSREERDAVVARWPDIFTYEGVAYWIDPAENSQPLYRFYNRLNGSHFYTAYAAEADHVIGAWPDVFIYEGQTYSVSTRSGIGRVPVYRFYNVRNGSHFYTSSDAERDHVRAAWPDVFTYEGVAFWLGQ